MGLPRINGEVGKLWKDCVAVSAQGLVGCIVESCDKKPVARGMCRTHYKAWSRRTPIDARPPACNLRSLTPAQRFAEKVTRGGPDECWPWQASTDKSGYGTFYVSPERGKVSAHVFAIELATGERCPPGKEGCHQCDNPPCCNPDHVYYGTRQQNVDDMIDRGRNQRGEQRWNARLTVEQVLDIRTRFANREPGPSIRSDYGLSSGRLSNIVNGHEWKHVGGPIRTHNKPGRRPSEKTD